MDLRQEVNLWLDSVDILKQSKRYSDFQDLPDIGWNIIFEMEKVLGELENRRQN